MKHTNVKNALLGVVIALVAALLFPIVLVTLLVGPAGLRFVLSRALFVGLFYTSWLVVPLGAALGMLIPRIAAGKSRWAAALHGAGYGAAGGLALVIGLTPVFRAPFTPDMIWVAVIAYCAVWVGAYAYLRAKVPVLHR